MVRNEFRHHPRDQAAAVGSLPSSPMASKPRAARSGGLPPLEQLALQLHSGQKMEARGVSGGSGVGSKTWLLSGHIFHMSACCSFFFSHFLFVHIFARGVMLTQD